MLGFLQSPPNATKFFIFALGCRLFSLVFGWIVTLFVSEYDLSTFETVDCSNSAICGYLRHLVRWDAVYFFNIAKLSYVYEQSMAFFPFYPYLMNRVSQICTAGRFADSDLTHLLQ